METLRVDFNRSRDGLLVSSISRASGPIALGDVVEIFQPGEDDLTTQAQVVSLNENGQMELLIRDNQAVDVSTRFLTDLLSWHLQTSSVLAQPSANYYPVNSRKQGWSNVTVETRVRTKV